LEEEQTSPVKVQIFGQEYMIASDEERQFIIRVAELVDERMRQVAQSASSASTVNVAVLTALNLAGDYLRAKQDLQHRPRRLISLIESEIDI
jgi:cell division protein ZapA